MRRPRRHPHARFPRVAREAEPGAAVYANHFEVGYNAFEFVLDFAQDYGGAPAGARRHTRIVTTPAYAKALCALLGRSLSDYEAAFGQVLPPATGTVQAGAAAATPAADAEEPPADPRPPG